MEYYRKHYIAVRARFNLAERLTGTGRRQDLSQARGAEHTGSHKVKQTASARSCCQADEKTRIIAEDRRPAPASTAWTTAR